jgi:hypothetical protein
MIASSRVLARVTCCAIVAATLGVACGDFARTNPVDPQAKVTLVLSGPDSVTAIGDTVTFEVRTPQGESLDGLANWSLPSFLRYTGVRNQFVAVAVPYRSHDTGTVAVNLNGSSATKPFLYAQQARSLSVTACDDGGKVITFTSFSANNPGRDAASVCIKLLDRRGNGMPDETALSGVIRDPRVASFVQPDQRELNALSVVGSTYVVYTQAGFTDSVRVDVRQDFAGLWPAPSACLTNPGVVLAPGQTVQVTAVPSDAHGNAIVDSAVARAALAGLVWGHTPALNVTVSSSGLVTAVGQSDGYVIAQKPLGQTVLNCSVSVR